MPEEVAEGAATAAPEPPAENCKQKSASRTRRDRSYLIPKGKSTKTATVRNADLIKRQVYLQHMEPMLQEGFEALRISARRGDLAAAKLIMEITQFVSAKGPAVSVTMNNRNDARAEAASVAGARNIDDLIRRLDSRETKVASAKDFIDV